MSAVRLLKDLFLLMLAIIETLAQSVENQPFSQEVPSEQFFGRQQPPLPPFLYNATIESRRQFFSIAYNPNYTVAEIKSQLEQWANDQPKDVQDAYNQQLNMQKQMEAMLTEERQKLVDALPADAREVAAKLDAIRDNLQLTPIQQMKQVLTMLSTTFIENFSCPG
ncbi:unnamed protein product [Toxocara canis]|uniref:DUF148 domain-containing protein n=1 Tax=Toxocara canis TaxID=6265 RepID=A0A183UVH7_TOXCA|nr:unnamed protein product [Toxocara canis]